MLPIGGATFGDRTKAAAGVVARLEGVVRKDRLMTDPLMTYAYSGDASSLPAGAGRGGDRQQRGRGPRRNQGRPRRTPAADVPGCGHLALGPGR